ncbi:translation initiation factor IF-2 [Anaerotalea alkaliphila]|uniref:Translation initiation factor IF-2 n=1 Tax=Anaerotalea alkaliphila TaxID=2662126 RepID=A0A7X5HTD4_9FIRM|nr:translation initiation factor IF-2 [Anaerotalea alkaliphila]NDL66320.1 translation initiation factor IF-2 [Anaerotalea alkaliphila]
MSKIRIHELAKELGIDNKELIHTLTGYGLEIQSHMNSVDEQYVGKVRQKYGKTAPATPSAPSAPPAPAKTSQQGETRSQSTGQGGQSAQGGQRPAGSGSQSQGGQRPAGSGYQGQRPAGSGSQSQGGQRPAGSGYQGQRPAGSGSQSQGGQRPAGSGYQGQRPAGQGGYQGQGGQRPAGSGYQGQRPAGQGGYQGQGGQRPAGTGYQGQRPTGQGGYQGQGGQRPAGTGYQGQGGQRPAGTGYQGQRPAGQGGQRPAGTGYQGQRPAGQGGQRPAGTGYQGRPAGGGYQGKDKDGGTDRRPQAGAAKEKTGSAKPGSSLGQGRFLNSGVQPGKANGAAKKKEFDKGDKEAAKNRTTRTGRGPQKRSKQPKPPVVFEERTVQIPETITVKEFAEVLKCAISDVVKKLMQKGIMATATQTIDFDTAVEIGLEFKAFVELEQEVEILDAYFNEEPEDPANLKPRPPVVVVMGHVDHGKTSLLDAIRKTNIQAGEQGGITQHIGASVVKINGKSITFLDTPGHEAFTAMRLRGAMATDIAILVVAADDGVMPQTIEAINHAKAAGVQIIIAINKIDKEGANPERVKQELIEHGLVAEDWGGDTICVPVSAMTREGIDNLLEMVLLVAEVEAYTANPKKPARGTIVEAKLDKGKGPVATVLIQKGTLRVGDPIIAGTSCGRVRAMIDDKGRPLKEAGPSTPVEIQGIDEVPVAGDAFFVARSDKEARTIADKIKAQGRVKLIQNTPQKVTLDDLFSQIKEGEMKELKLIVKADVQGSVEAVRSSLVKLSNDEVAVNIIHGGVGAINESDVMLASASNAIIIGFNVRPEAMATQKADNENVDIRLYKVIYNAIEDMEAAMKGMLEPIFAEKVTGHVEIRQIIKVSGVGTIGGAYVLDGKIVRNSKVRLLRDQKVIYEGQLGSLKRFKDDVKEVNAGYECGVMLDKYNDIKEGDIVEAYIMEEVPR